MTYRILGLGGASFLALALGFFAISGTNPAPGPYRPVAVSSGVHCEGRVAAYPGCDVLLAAEYGGRLDQLTVRELDLVEGGQVLARLNTREQTATLATAQAKVRELEVQVSFQELEQGRQKRLLALGAVGQRNFDEADSQLRLVQAQRQTALATVKQLEAALAKLTLLAPFAGTIVESLAQPGELLVPGAKVLRLANLKRLRVEAEVDEYDLGGLKLGRSVNIKVEGQPGTLQGRVEELPAALSQRRLKALDPSRPSDIRVALVKIALPDGTSLRLGQRVELAIH